MHAKVKVDLMTIEDAVKEYMANHDGRHPAPLDELVTPDATGYRLPNTPRVPRDPWGREYLYITGPYFNELTLGRDGVVGGDGADADIDSRTSGGGR